MGCNCRHPPRDEADRIKKAALLVTEASEKMSNQTAAPLAFYESLAVLLEEQQKMLRTTPGGRPVVDALEYALTQTRSLIESARGSNQW